MHLKSYYVKIDWIEGCFCFKKLLIILYARLRLVHLKKLYIEGAWMVCYLQWIFYAYYT